MTRRKRMLNQLDEDIRDHIERETQDNIDRGMSPQEARYAALRKFGNVTRVKEQTREVWSIKWLEQFLQDLRYGARTLARSPSLTIAAVLAIALGIGINVGIFSVLNGLTLRLLPIPRASEMLSIDQVLHFHGHGHRDIHENEGYFSWSEYRAYRDQNHVFSGLAAYEPYVSATLAGGNVRPILGTAATCNYFDVLEESPALGRGFAGSDCSSPGANAVVVLSDTLWRTQFAADPALIGKPILLNRMPYTVIGIARPGFTGTEPVPGAFWVPVTMQKALDPGQDRLANNDMSWLAMLGRMRPGVTPQEVRADLSITAQRIDQQYSWRTTTLAIQKARFFSSPVERQSLIPVSSVILAAFALVLLIACANVANLLLARATVRQREIALRLSLGAGRWRLVRQLLTESLLLSLAGGILGSLIACLSSVRLTSFVTRHLPDDFPATSINVAPDLHVLVYALLLTLCTGIVFGLVPALQSTRPDLNNNMKGDGGSASSRQRSGRFLLKTLVGSQVAVCMVLLLAAGLLLRGLYYAQTVDPGFEIKGVAASFLDLGRQGYDQPRATRFMMRFVDQLRGLPGVTEVAQAESAPLAHDFSGDHFTLPGRSDQIPIEYNHVTPSYFSLIGIPIVRGRNFTSAENHDAPGVIVTESTARRLWPGKDPLGQTLRDSPGREHIVIGVVRDAQVSHLGESTSNYLYYPLGPEDDARSYVLVRYATSFGDVAKDMRAAAHSIDPNLACDVIRLDDYLEVWRAPSRIVAGLSGTLGILALLLCSIGVYGMVSYSVSRSVREIGIRLALGADKADVLRNVLWQSMRPVLIGGAVGVILCAMVSGVLASMMFGIGAHDPVAFVFVPCFLFAVAAAATLIPARRATDVNPVVALRCE
jgi:macrolide transport system ATP-binding/permease protein